MGIASFVLGIITVIITLLKHPIIAILIGVIGIILGIADLIYKAIKKNKVSVFGIIGLIISIIAIAVVGFISIFNVFGYFDEEDDYNYQIKNEEENDNDNPIEGDWLADGSGAGYFEFDDNTFYWYESQLTKTDNYYRGTYTITRGALQNNGNIDYGVDGHEIYTIMLDYKAQMVNGIYTERTDQGMFVVQKQNNNKFTVRNMLNNSFFDINRVD